jgi:hypothetical protein
MIRNWRGLGDSEGNEGTDQDQSLNLPTWVPQAYDSLTRQAPDLAANSDATQMILGWISVESGGKYWDSTTKTFPQGENGLFQISPDESRSLGLDHGRLLTDFDYSMLGGIKLVQANMARVAAMGYDPSEPIFWRMVKYVHSTGAGGVQQTLNAAAQAGVDTHDWDALESYIHDNEAALLHLTKHSQTKWSGNVDKVMVAGLPLIVIGKFAQAIADTGIPGWLFLLAGAGALYWAFKDG